MEGIKLLSLNVRGMRGKKRFSIFRWLKERKYDICLLQETYCTDDFVKIFDKSWGGNIFHSCSTSVHSRGVCILFSDAVKQHIKIIDTHNDKEGRIVLVNAEIYGEQLTIVNIYAPNDVSVRSEFLKDLEEFVFKHRSTRNIVIGGDFNCIANTMDRAGGKLDRSSEIFDKIKTSLDVIDVWRHIHPREVGYTFIDPSSRGKNSRIDYWLLHRSLGYTVDKCSILQAPAPDHKALVLCLKLNAKKRGKGYWKLNNTILDEDKYKTGIEELITTTLNKFKDKVSMVILWDYLKIKIKEFTLAYCTGRAKANANRVETIEKRMDIIDSKKEISKDEIRERAELKTELDSTYSERAIGYQIRSRVKWIEEGERSTSYFLGMEKARQTGNKIECLRNANGLVSKSDKDILETACDFYKTLYSSKITQHETRQEDLKNYFECLPDSFRLTEGKKKKCEGKIGLDECLVAMLKMKKNKSPGLDGLTVEFFQTFWHLLGKLLCDIYNESYITGKLPQSMRISVMTLIHKKEDRDDIANYRPISLTNVDYRILAFIMSNRVQAVIKDIISSDQTAYIKGRYMGTNIRLISDIIDYYDIENKSGILLNLDFIKAFDSLEWDFLNETLKHFNFGDSFIGWVKTMYKNPIACLKNNGHLSETFHISRGIRQGCPLSALLFIMCTEILGQKIRHESKLKGFNFGFTSKPIKLVQYADDCTIFFNNSKEINIALILIKHFGRLSGLKLNPSKCEGFWLGRDKELREKSKTKFGFKWPDQFKCLGIYLGYNEEKNITMNVIEKINKLDVELARWKKRDLTLFGKIQVIKSLALSRMVFQASIIDIPERYIKQINTKMYAFIWGARDKVKRKTLNMPLEKGGLNMVDIKIFFKSLLATWIFRIKEANPEMDGWVQLPMLFLRHLNYDDKLPLLFNYDGQILFYELEKLPSFYRNVVKYYNEAFVTDKSYFLETIMNQPLWGNKYITKNIGPQKSVLFLSNWIKGGIRYVRDLNFIDGELNEVFILAKVKSKQNIYCEMLEVKKALRPYKQHIIGGNDLPIVMKSLCSSREIYAKLREQDEHTSPFLKKYVLNGDIKGVFINKIVAERELKLREFNFKVLHGILPCNSNLKKWGKTNMDECDVCGMKQTIEHLLYTCIYVRNLWSIFDRIHGKASFLKLLGFEERKTNDRLITIVCFIIYKEWLLLSLENKRRDKNINIKYFSSEIESRITIYRKSSIIEKEVIDMMENFCAML